MDCKETLNLCKTDILKKAYDGQRLSLEEGTLLLKQGDLFEIGELADYLCKKKHTDNTVTFIVDRNITFTNVCTVKCKFCAFYRTPKSTEAFLLSKDEIFNKIEELIKLGGTQIMLQAGLHPGIDLDYYLDLYSSIKQRFDIDIHSASPPEIAYLSKKSNLTIKEVLIRLKEAGLNSLPGGGAEILVDRVRQIVSPNKIKTDTWLEVMRSAHQIGMWTTATMVYGMVETLEERIIHLIRLRQLQDESRLQSTNRFDTSITGGFRAFIPWSFQPGNTQLSDYCPASGVDYLKMVSISRIMLDNIDNLQAGWVTEGPKLGQLALCFGANDMGGILMEEVVVKATGVEHLMDISSVVRLIKETGKIPAQRNTRYEILRRF